MIATKMTGTEFTYISVEYKSRSFTVLRVHISQLFLCTLCQQSPTNRVQCISLENLYVCVF